ncbi:DNA methyltransferase [Scytonema sp. PCC 10023]|uniref:DNA methyltransferase n=1 Tax=Scytonema sp. PCC 10023 TaxID=1680591 RepID=UPI0039C72931
MIEQQTQKILNLTPYYSQKNGSVYLGDSLKLLQFIEDNSINLIITSPPFALTRQKEYGNQSEEKYIEWFLPFAYEFKRVLAENGSFILDLGGAYLPGHPVRSIYQYELLVRLCKEVGFFLAQEFYHRTSSPRKPLFSKHGEEGAGEFIPLTRTLKSICVTILFVNRYTKSITNTSNTT